MLNRIQNYLLVAWALIVALLLVFNWGMAWRAASINFLFMTFSLPLVFWLIVAPLLAGVVLHMLNLLSLRAAGRRTQQQLAEVRADAHARRGEELESLIGRLEQRLKALTSDQGQASADSGEGKPADTASGACRAALPPRALPRPAWPSRLPTNRDPSEKSS